MRKYLHIDLKQHTVREEQLAGEAIARAGRYLIAKTLVEAGVAGADPLGLDNPLIFSAGPFAGSNWSNANRISVGCKSPLTGGIKESNGGGSFGLALGQLEIAGFTLHDVSPDWVVIHLKKDGTLSFDTAEPFMGRANFDCARMLHEKYGDKVSLAICGPVGEYQGLLAGIALSDTDRRPARLAARGGVGAVMGSKRVKAIVAELHKMPTFHDRKKVIKGIREYGTLLQADDAIAVFKRDGTAMMSDYTNHIGALPVNNFSAGQQINTNDGTFKMGAEFVRTQNQRRGGEISHACMPGCLIECSNVYVDEDGQELVSPMEYETLGIMGTNCGISDPDDLARLNYLANDFGIDTIETGALMGVLLDAGLAEFGDVAFMTSVLNEIGKGTEQGRLWARGTAWAGAHYGVGRTPVIKKQAISAYDPRIIEVTGISMMVTAQGADHTTGNLPKYDCAGKDVDELVDASMEIQTICAATDSLGLCVFGRSVTNVNIGLIIGAINDAIGTDLTEAFFHDLGRATLRYEAEFNKAAGFTEDDNELPAFFYNEAFPPRNQVARFHAQEVNQAVSRWWARNGG